MFTFFIRWRHQPCCTFKLAAHFSCSHDFWWSVLRYGTDFSKKDGVDDKPEIWLARGGDDDDDDDDDDGDDDGVDDKPEIWLARGGGGDDDDDDDDGDDHDDDNDDTTRPNAESS